MGRLTYACQDLLESWKDEIINGKAAEPSDIKRTCVFWQVMRVGIWWGRACVVGRGVTKS